jgi:tetratricopeptide (TPR) repeat protein
MQCLPSRLAVVGFWLCAFMTCPAFAQQMGDWVVATRDAQLREGDRVVGMMHHGIFSRVQAVHGDLLWVEPGARGWVDRKEVVTLDQAVPYFTDAIAQNPNDHHAYRARGNAWYLKGQFDKAIADHSEAIRLNPNNGGSRHDRGLAWNAKGEWDKAIADYNEAIRLRPTFMQYFNRGLVFRHKDEHRRAIADFDEALRLAPKYTPAYRARGLAYELTGQYERAIADFQEAIRINPAYAGSYASLAQLQACCPDDRYRDGAKALENAKQACTQSGWKSGDALDAMAAACAETGDFEKAQQYEAKAIELVNEQKMKDKYRTRLELYQANKPYRIEPTGK